MTRVSMGLFGAGGFGREVMPILLDSVKANFSEETIIDTYFVTQSNEPKTINSQPNLSEIDFLNQKTKFFNVAIAEYNLRKTIVERCVEKNATPLSIFSSNFIQYQENKIAEGAIFCAHSMITSNITIGKYFHANIFSYVGHDCVIGDYVTFAPKVQCNGNVHIADSVYIGTGAIIREGTRNKPLTIGKGAVVGMGAVVTKDVAPFTTVVGNPARVLDKRN
jgi:sugar O-acyltransferase (sialic acid O-acetyltransferase NeuD family)